MKNFMKMKAHSAKRNGMKTRAQTGAIQIPDYSSFNGTPSTEKLHTRKDEPKGYTNVLKNVPELGPEKLLYESELKQPSRSFNGTHPLQSYNCEDDIELDSAPDEEEAGNNDYDEQPRKLWCTCTLPKGEKPFVVCENLFCTYEFFHFSCVGLNDMPSDGWCCNECIPKRARTNSSGSELEKGLDAKVNSDSMVLNHVTADSTQLQAQMDSLKRQLNMETNERKLYKDKFESANEVITAYKFKVEADQRKSNDLARKLEELTDRFKDFLIEHDKLRSKCTQLENQADQISNPIKYSAPRIDITELSPEFEYKKRIPEFLPRSSQSAAFTTRNKNNSQLQAPELRTPLATEIGAVVGETMAAVIELNQMNIALSSLQTLQGYEVYQDVVRYFKKLESMTLTWNSIQRANLLSLKVEDRARMIVESQPEEVQNDYYALKNVLFSKLCNADSRRILSQDQLAKGIPRTKDESIEQFALRVEQTVRSAFSAKSDELDILDHCKTYFLKYLNERRIIEVLSLLRTEVDFHSLVVKALTLKSTAQTSQLSEEFQFRTQTNFLRTCPNFNSNNDTNSNERENRLHYNNDFGEQVSTPFASRTQPNNGNSFRSRFSTKQHSNGTRNPTSAFQSQNNTLQARMVTTNGNAIPVGEIPTTPQNVLAPKISSTSKFDALNEILMNGNLNGAKDTNGVICQVLVNSNVEPPRIASIVFGRSPTSLLIIQGVPCLSLLDSGSQVSIITAQCLNLLCKKTGLNPLKSGMHQPTINAVSACKTPLKTVAAITLDVVRSNCKVPVEFQIVNDSLPFPIIAGTNCLNELGFRLFDTLTSEEVPFVLQNEKPNPMLLSPITVTPNSYPIVLSPQSSSEANSEAGVSDDAARLDGERRKNEHKQMLKVNRQRGIYHDQYHMNKRCGGRFRTSAEEKQRHWIDQQKNKPVLYQGVTGKVKWYSFRKRYGFIQIDEDQQDIFVYQLAISKSHFRKPTLRTLRHGEIVQFDVVQGKKGLEASNVTGPNGTEVQGSHIIFIFKDPFDRFDCQRCPYYNEFNNRPAVGCRSITVQQILPHFESHVLGPSKISTLSKQVLLAVVSKNFPNVLLEDAVKQIVNSAASDFENTYKDLAQELKVFADRELPVSEVDVDKKTRHKQQTCDIASLFATDRMPLKMVGECAPLFCTALYENCLQPTSKCAIDDVLGFSWEKTRASVAHNFVGNFVQDPFVAITSVAGQEIVRYSECKILEVSGSQSALNLVRETTFLGSVQTVLYVISHKDIGDPNLLQYLQAIIKEMEGKQVNFLIVPPPPTKPLEKYREVMKFLVNEEAGKIARLTEDGDAFGAIGRNGNRIHLDEVKKEGGWTARGLNRARNFLVETLGFKFLVLRLVGKEPPKIRCQPQLRAQDQLRNTLTSAPKGQSQVIVPPTPLFRNIIPPPQYLASKSFSSTFHSLNLSQNEQPGPSSRSRSYRSPVSRRSTPRRSSSPSHDSRHSSRSHPQY